MEEERGKEKGGHKETSPKNNSNKSNEILKEESPAKKKAKSCKGFVYYSSTFKSNSRNPLCLGIPRSLPSDSEIRASKQGRNLSDFKYACVGYSIYLDRKGSSVDAREKQAELPICPFGLEIVQVRTAVDPDPAHVQNKEDAHVFQPHRTHKPTHSAGDEFLSRFSRNANVVAMGVAKNLRRVGNKIKDRLDDMLYPYRRRPK